LIKALQYFEVDEQIQAREKKTISATVNSFSKIEKQFIV